MSDHNFFLHDAVHILRSNGTDDHADAVQWAAAEIERLRAECARKDEEYIALESDLEKEREVWPAWAVKLEKFMRGRLDLNSDEAVDLDDVTAHIAEIERLTDEEMQRRIAAEAQRDALVVAAEPIIAESSREDRDDYRVRVKTADIRALAAAVACARTQEDGGEG